ncbi:hypothetical protein P5673_016239, partial [Acropora cervicornis]
FDAQQLFCRIITAVL